MQSSRLKSLYFDDECFSTVPAFLRDCYIPWQGNDAGGGFGLFSIEERMADPGVKPTITSQAGAGCKAVLLVPIQQHKQEIKA